MDRQKGLQIGQIVEIVQGRDAGKYAVVIEIVDGRFVLLADGDKRKFDHPRKKNRMHISTTNTIAEEVRSSLLETGRVTNAKLRFVIQKFIEAQEAKAGGKESE